MVILMAIIGLAVPDSAADAKSICLSLCFMFSSIGIVVSVLAYMQYRRQRAPRKMRG